MFPLHWRLTSTWLGSYRVTLGWGRKSSILRASSTRRWWRGICCPTKSPSYSSVKNHPPFLLYVHHRHRSRTLNGPELVSQKPSDLEDQVNCEICTMKMWRPFLSVTASRYLKWKYELTCIPTGCRIAVTHFASRVSRTGLALSLRGTCKPTPNTMPTTTSAMYPPISAR